MRAHSPLLCLLAAGCGGAAPQTQANRTAGAEPQVECAVDGAAAYSAGCTVERQGNLLVIRAPAGSFRRLRIGANGELAAADGAEPLRLLGRDGQTVEAAIAGDRYRIPKRMLR
jgi:hypothetical protein